MTGLSYLNGAANNHCHHRLHLSVQVTTNECLKYVISICFKKPILYAENLYFLLVIFYSLLLEEQVYSQQNLYQNNNYAFAGHRSCTT